RHRRLRPRPTSAPPLEDDDLLDEILLRLSPDPSSLPRASAVCARWRRLVSDPGFASRFRLRHHCNVQLWRRKIDCDGEASWVLGRTFELDTLLSLNSEEKEPTVMLGLAEYNNAVVVQTVAGHFMVHE
uniref:F-box domain-containing protein n=1 Tax=Aegilops tauschii subsp. strangulata TaxID=200361 RepID=A0A453MY42_AEGTS